MITQQREGWKRVGHAWVTDDWDRDANIARLRFFREYHGFETQTEFANHLGIAFKRWSHYELGYPLPREPAFILREKFGSAFSAEWIWWGLIGTLQVGFWRAADAAGVPQETLAEFDARMKWKPDEAPVR